MECVCSSTHNLYKQGFLTSKYLAQFVLEYFLQMECLSSKLGYHQKLVVSSIIVKFEIYPPKLDFHSFMYPILSPERRERERERKICQSTMH